MWLRRQMGRRWGGGGAVKWHSWQMTSPVSQSPLLSTMICHLHFWHFSSHYQITLTEWYFLILPALEHTKNNGLHMLCALVLFPCPSVHFRSRVSRKYPVISSFFCSNEYVAVEKTLLAGPAWKQWVSQRQFKLSGLWRTQPVFALDPSNGRERWEPSSEAMTATPAAEEFTLQTFMTVCMSRRINHCLVHTG